MIIAVDTCVLIDFQSGAANRCVSILRENLLSYTVRIAPVVLTEILSNHRLDKKNQGFFKEITQLEIYEDYWQRAGETRRILLKKGLKAKLGDALIAQACIDNSVPLLTRDSDFSHYAKYCGLRLV